MRLVAFHQTAFDDYSELLTTKNDLRNIIPRVFPILSLSLQC